MWGRLVHDRPIFRGLSGDELSRLRSLSEGFLSWKQLDPVGDAKVTKDLAATIAALACLPVLNRGLDWYKGWATIIVTSSDFAFEETEYDESGLAHDIDEFAAGEIMPLGPLVFSVEAVEASGWGEGFNVVIHEAAHALDRRDGDLNGAPPLPTGMDPAEWRDVFLAAFRNLTNRARTRKGRRALPIDEYALDSPEEFFAVTSELFFEIPAQLRGAYPGVYEQLSRFYAQDPAARQGAAGR